MTRAPAAGYNHDLRYKNRVFHVQTEVSNPRGGAEQSIGERSRSEVLQVATDVFCEGLVLLHTSTNCAEAGCQDEVARQDLAQEQHKAHMRRLLRGQLDQEIVVLLGELEPIAPQVRRYVHYLEHHERTFSVETRFLRAVTTDIYCDAVLIVSETVSAGPAAADDVVRHWAQDQHKRMLRRLHDGQYDERIVELLGSLAPPPIPRRRPGTGQLRALESIATEASESEEVVTLEHYHHAMKYRGKLFEAETEQVGGEHPHVVAELRLGEEVITRKLRELCPEAAHERARCTARALHKELLIELKSGELDDVIEILEEM